MRILRSNGVLLFDFTVLSIFYKEKTCAHLELKETKNATYFLMLKAHTH